MDVQKGIWVVSQDHIPYLKAQNANGNHILMQPVRRREPFYLIADDLNCNLLKKHHKRPDGTWKPGRMVIETSTGNHQVWIHSNRPLPLHEKRFWLKKMHSDPAADPRRRWGRCPGFFNPKEKHRSAAGKYPLAKLIWIDWQSAVDIPKLPRKRPPPAKQGCTLSAYKHASAAPSRSEYERNNESVTDFAYALALARRNFSKQQIIDRILAERVQWDNHCGDSRKRSYLERTVSKAIHIVERHPI